MELDRDGVPAGAAARPFGGVVDRLEQRGGEVADVVGLHEPAGLAVGDDLARAEAVDGDRRHFARHRLDEHEAELLAHRRQREQVGDRQDAGTSTWSYQPARKTPRTSSRSIVSAGCYPSHSPGWPPTIMRPAGARARSRACAKASMSSGSRLTAVKRLTVRITTPSMIGASSSTLYRTLPACWSALQPRGASTSASLSLRRAIDVATDEDARIEPFGQHDQSDRVEV